MTDISLTSALADVRRAYRLVYAYQRRLFDIVAAFEDGITKEGYTAADWGCDPFWLPKGSDRAIYRDRWAWDLSLGYSPYFAFETKTDAAGAKKRIGLIAQVDTGFRRGLGEPDPKDFGRVEDARSEIHCRLWRVGRADVNLGAAREQLQAEKRDVMDDGKTHEFKFDGAQISYRLLHVDLAELPDLATVTAKLIDPVIDAMR